MSSQDIELEKRIANAAEILQSIFTHSKISMCQNLHSRREDCIPSCKTIDFFIKYKTLKDMSDQLEVTEQPENSTVNNEKTLKFSTSNPSGTFSEQNHTKKKF